MNGWIHDLYGLFESCDNIATRNSIRLKLGHVPALRSHRERIASHRPHPVLSCNSRWYARLFIAYILYHTQDKKQRHRSNTIVYNIALPHTQKQMYESHTNSFQQKRMQLHGFCAKNIPDKMPLHWRQLLVPWPRIRENNKATPDKSIHV